MQHALKYDSEDQLELRSDTHTHTHMQAVAWNSVAVRCFSSLGRSTEAVACGEEPGRWMVGPCDCSAPLLPTVIASDSPLTHQKSSPGRLSV